MANGTTQTMPGFGPTANDRLKDSFSSWFWGSVAVAAVVHGLVIGFWPEMTAADVSIGDRSITAVELPPEVKIPPPPEQIQRPAIPVISTNVNIQDDITISETTFSENPISDLPPPPTGGGVDVSEAPTFTPYEVKPEMRNRSELVRTIERNYPSTLKDAGIGGTVRVWVFIDESGSVKNTRVVESSGYPALDKAAEEAMKVVKFSPALNRDQKVAVWVQFPVTFQVQ
jgi:TonB family protein